jgi:hypothetical protein
VEIEKDKGQILYIYHSKKTGKKIITSILLYVFYNMPVCVPNEGTAKNK